MSLFGGDTAPTSVPSSPSLPPQDDMNDLSDFSIEDISQPSPWNSRRGSVSSHHSRSPQNAAGSAAFFDAEGASEDDNEPSGDDDKSDYSSANASRSQIRARTWLRHTATERELHASLVALCAEDLSAHLYNTHALKMGLRSSPTVDPPALFGQSSCISTHQIVEEQQWVPDNDWTAWPLPPDSVPEADALAGTWGSHAHKAIGRRNEKISGDLEDEIKAVLLKRAKEMWVRSQLDGHASSHDKNATAGKSRTRSVSRGPTMKREPDRPRNGSAFGKSPISASESAETQPSITAVPDPTSGQQSPARLPASSPPYVNPTAAASVKNEDLEENESSGPTSPARFPPSSPPSFHSCAAASMKSENLERDHDDSDSDQPIHLVFSADDDRSHKFLAPPVRHIMSDLDALLLALHHHRVGQFAKMARRNSRGSRTRSLSPLASRERSRSARSSSRRSATPATPRRRSTGSGSAPRSHGKSTEDCDEDDEVLDAEREEGQEGDPYRDISESASFVSSADTESSCDRSQKGGSEASSNSRSRQTHTKQGPRDWSVILGLAALSGWDSAVIARAAKRCEGLFDASMHFRTFPEAGTVSEGIEDTDKTNNLFNDDTEQPLEHDTDDEDFNTENAAPVVSYLCSFEACGCDPKPFRQYWRLTEHLRRTHKLTSAQYPTRASQTVWNRGALTTNAPLSGIGGRQGSLRRYALDNNLMEWRPPSPLICELCGPSSPVYSTISRLLDHLKRTHKYDPRVQAQPEMRQMDEEGDERTLKDVTDLRVQTTRKRKRRGVSDLDEGADVKGES